MIKADHKYGDVILRYGTRGWYVKGHSKFGHFEKLRELKDALMLVSIEATMEECVKLGYLERVS